MNGVAIAVVVGISVLAVAYAIYMHRATNRGKR